MLQLHFSPSPNSWKVTIMLEECGLDYQLVPVDLVRGEQYSPEFLALNPNARMPVLVDPEPPEQPVTVFESGAILQYLGHKTGRFLPRERRAYFETMQWLFWQMANLGPMGGQANHFAYFAPPGNDYGRERYIREYERLLAVMDYRLRDRQYLAGDYSIADMAAYPWTLTRRRFDLTLEHFPHLARWTENLKARPALRRGMDVGREEYRQLQQMEVSPELRETMFAQGRERYSEPE